MADKEVEYIYERVSSDYIEPAEVGDLVPLEEDQVRAVNPVSLDLDSSNENGIVMYDYEDGYYSVDFDGVTRVVRADDIVLLNSEGEIQTMDNLDEEDDNVVLLLIGEEVPALYDKVARVNAEGVKIEPVGMIMEDLHNGWYVVSFGAINDTLRADEIELLDNLSPEDNDYITKRLTRGLLLRLLYILPALLFMLLILSSVGWKLVESLVWGNIQERVGGIIFLSIVGLAIFITHKRSKNKV